NIMGTSENSRALIVVDMQNAFIDPTKGAPVSGAAETVLAVNYCIEDAIREQRPIFYTRDIDPTGQPGKGGHDDEMHPDVLIRGTVIDKGPGSHGEFSGFLLAAPKLTGGWPGRGGLSKLAPLLLKAAVHEVEVVGVAADVCVASTAADAVTLSYRVTVNLAASAFVHAHPSGNDAAVRDM